MARSQGAAGFSPRESSTTQSSSPSSDTTGRVVDLLWSGGQVHEFAAERIDSTNTHGTGCVLSAAITARPACGESLVDAVRDAKRFVTAAIRTAPGLGGGVGPTNMHADVTTGE